MNVIQIVKLLLSAINNTEVSCMESVSKTMLHTVGLKLDILCVGQRLALSEQRKCNFNLHASTSI